MSLSGNDDAMLSSIQRLAGKERTKAFTAALTTLRRETDCQRS